MSDEELTEHWRKTAEARWQTDFDDLNRERAGVQGSRISRFTGGKDAMRVSSERKTGLASLLISQAYRQAYESFMSTATRALDFYDDALDELREMQTEFEQMRTELAGRTIRLQDGRAVYIDKQGRYVYQDAEGAWQGLLAAAGPIAACCRRASSRSASSRAEKEAVDDFGVQVAHARTVMKRNRNETQHHIEDGENGKLETAEDVEAVEDSIGAGQEDAEALLDSVRNQRNETRHVLSARTEIREHVHRTGSQKYDNNTVERAKAESMFGNLSAAGQGISASDPAIAGAGKAKAAFAAASTGLKEGEQVLDQEPERVQSPSPAPLPS